MLLFPRELRELVEKLAAGETITVKLSYVQTVDYNKGEFGFRFPMTLTPRFIPAETLTGPPGSLGCRGINKGRIYGPIILADNDFSAGGSSNCPYPES